MARRVQAIVERQHDHVGDQRIAAVPASLVAGLRAERLFPREPAETIRRFRERPAIDRVGQMLQDQFDRHDGSGKT
jgi:hypothetical protein